MESYGKLGGALDLKFENLNMLHLRISQISPEFQTLLSLLRRISRISLGFGFAKRGSSGVQKFIGKYNVQLYKVQVDSVRISLFKLPCLFLHVFAVQMLNPCVQCMPIDRSLIHLNELATSHKTSKRDGVFRWVEWQLTDLTFTFSTFRAFLSLKPTTEITVKNRKQMMFSCPFSDMCHDLCHDVS